MKISVHILDYGRKKSVHNLDHGRKKSVHNLDYGRKNLCTIWIMEKKVCAEFRLWKK